MYVLKSNYEIEDFDEEKLKKSLSVSANLVGVTLTEELMKGVATYVKNKAFKDGRKMCASVVLRDIVENALSRYDTKIAESYMKGRGYKYKNDSNNR